MNIVLETIRKLARVLNLGFYVLGGELRRTFVALSSKNKAQAMNQAQVKKRIEKFRLNPDSTVFFQGN